MLPYGRIWLLIAIGCLITDTARIINQMDKNRSIFLSCWKDAEVLEKHLPVNGSVEWKIGGLLTTPFMCNATSDNGWNRTFTAYDVGMINLSGRELNWSLRPDGLYLNGDTPFNKQLDWDEIDSPVELFLL